MRRLRTILALVGVLCVAGLSLAAIQTAATRPWGALLGAVLCFASAEGLGVIERRLRERPARRRPRS